MERKKELRYYRFWIEYLDFCIFEFIAAENEDEAEKICRKRHPDYEIYSHGEGHKYCATLHKCDGNKDSEFIGFSKDIDEFKEDIYSRYPDHEIRHIIELLPTEETTV